MFPVKLYYNLIITMFQSSNVTMTTEQSVAAGQHPKHCPECQKKGVKKKVKPFHINLEEEVGVMLCCICDEMLIMLIMQGVFMCEDVNCPWPFNDKNIQEFVVSLKSNK